MIDWWDIIINGLWILGLAIVVAAFSYRSAWKTYQPNSRAMFWAEDIWPALGLAMFCFGLGLISDQTWKLLVWIVLGLISLGMPLLYKFFERRKNRAG
jgi:cell division protein FtsW (lipid II flippase)